MIDEITSAETINLVIAKYRKRSVAGIDNLGREELVKQKETIVRSIQARLAQFSPHPLKETQSHGRTVWIPTLEDRILQMTICNVLTRHIKWQPSTGPFRFVTGERALKHYWNQYKKRFGEVVCHADIERYFDSIDHDRFTEFLFRYIKHIDVVDLIRTILGIVPLGTGLKIGNPLGTYLADRFLVASDESFRGKAIIRFHDDYYYFASGREQCFQFVEALAVVLGTINLKLNSTKVEVIVNPDSYEAFIRH